MSVQPLGSPFFQAYDSNGDPLSGGLLYTYAGGTSTPQATYTDSTGSVANANPVVLDSAGRADVWMTPAVLYKFVLKDSGGSTIKTTDNFPSPASSSTGSTSGSVNEPGGRLTYSSSLAVSTADLTGQATVYYYPYKSDQVPLYNGSSWTLTAISFLGISQALSDTLKSPAAAVANSNYDLFLWLDGSTVRLSRGPPWTSDTARGTGAGTTQIAQQNGRWVNAQNITNGPVVSCGLYVGTIRTDGSIQGNDSFAKRHCWNAYNRAPRPMLVTDVTGPWAYTTAAFRQANGAAANQLDFVVGLLEDEVTAETTAAASSSTVGATMISAIGMDSTTVASGAWGLSQQQVASETILLRGKYRGFPGLGRHFLAWLEYGGTNVSFASNGVTTKAGISGEVRG